MNPYDFVPIEIDYPPELRRPVWHNALAPNAEHPAKLYSGSLVLNIKAETPLFIGATTSNTQDPDHPGEHKRNKAGKPIIPGTAIKGLLRTVVETLCRGCLTGYEARPQYRPYPYPAPRGFEPCDNDTRLCVACRLFGMMARERKKDHLFLGKVSVMDAVAYPKQCEFASPIYTAVLEGPKHRHSAFYQNARGELAGRKFYFHQATLAEEDELIEIKPKPGEYRNHAAKKYRNQHIRPIQAGSWFQGSLTFHNLEADEFAALLFALSLKESNMRHKIGYGKPIGLGSALINIQEMTLVDYATRYTNLTSQGSRGLRSLDEDEMDELIAEKMAPHDQEIYDAWRRYRDLPSLDRLYEIWHWPVAENVEYFYPGQRWFQQNPRAPIAATRGM